MTDTKSAPVRTTDGIQVPTAGRYEIDGVHSSVAFSVRHAMVAKTKGRFGDVSGTIVIAEDPSASTVEVRIGAASIDTRDEGRDGHLRSPDFLDVETYPELTYRSTGVRRDGDDWIVDGELTIKGVTRPVTLEVEFEGGVIDPWGNPRLGFSASAEIDREDFGLTWNQVLETGGVLVGKKIKIDLDVEAVAAA